MNAMTPEQERHHAELVSLYGLPLVEQARQLSGLRLAVQSLALDDLDEGEREAAYCRAGLHLAQLLEHLLTAERSAQLCECAQRIDVAIDLWVADAIEAREGLPRS